MPDAQPGFAVAGAPDAVAVADLALLLVTGNRVDGADVDAGARGGAGGGAGGGGGDGDIGDVVDVGVDQAALVPGVAEDVLVAGDGEGGLIGPRANLSLRA